MKRNYCLKLTAWLLMITLLLGVCLPAVVAEQDGQLTQDVTSDEYSHGIVLYETVLDSTFVKSADVVDQKGNKVNDISAQDPNNPFTLKLVVSEPENAATADQKLPEDTNEVSLIYELGENMTAADGSNNVVAWEYDEESNVLEFSWVNGYQTSFSADITVIPALPAENDLSGSYVLGTYGKKETYKVMLGTESFMDGKRARLKGYAFSEVDGKVYILSEEAASVWELKHVSGNYYVVRSKENGKYLKIDTANNGLLLEEATDVTAQKLLVEKSSKDGYYFFKYKDKSINNSSFSALPTKGFASYNASDKGDNTILKLYNPSDVITEPIRDLSGTWVIANAVRNNVMTAEQQSNGRIKASGVTVEGNYIVTQDDMPTFTFENIIRDWYIIKTDGGYLNISKDGAFISDNPQHLVVKTDKQYSSIILSDNELYDVGYTLNNVNGNKSNGYGVVLKHTYDDNTRLTLIRTENILQEQPEMYLAFDLNGGTANAVPEKVAGVSGQKIVLPDLSASKNGEAFIGWAEVKDIYAVNAGTNHRYHDVYKPGTTYTLKSGVSTLYAMYNTTVKEIQFGIRKDGVIQDEPNSYSASAYGGHIKIANALKESYWVIDINSTKAVTDYYVANDVTANLNRMPTAEEMVEALKKDGNIDFDPETQYIHWYVLKCNANNSWHVDGVIRNRTNVEVSYNANVPGTEKTKVEDMPGSYQVAPGTEILIGINKDNDTVLTPRWSGHVFTGWNTEADGSGIDYAVGNYVRLRSNLNLYAQWADEEEITITLESDWPKGKPAPSGTLITLTAKLSGFDKMVEGEDYVLQWQYSLDQENWIDEPDANSINHTYELNVTTAQYIWRVVARKPQ